jgi:NAD(P)-dependent dehydrogenase (short-subunit alcohol dehydrogenase family)
MSKPTLAGKVVLVTGAGGGIGSFIAKLAAAQGAKIVVNDLGGSPEGEGADAAPAKRIADEIIAAGGEAVPSYHSIATWDSAQAIVQDAIDAFGRIDGVVNNAGILRDTIFHKMTPEQWDTVIQVDLSGYYYVSRAAAPYFKEQKGGTFVHMSSTSGLVGNFGQVNYGAAKLGVAGLSKNIALDMSRFNVRSNAIAPFAYTRMVGTIPADTEENRRRLEVVKRMTPDKIAPLAVSLMTDAAADVTGQIFGVRNNEIMLFSQPRPIRTVHTSDGWTVESVLSTAIPAMKASFFPLDRSSDVFVWDPV